MESMLVYHYPGCSKSRGALEILSERGVEHDVVEYLNDPIDAAELDRILGAISDPPADLVRKDKKFVALGLDPDDYTTKEQVIAILLAHPELMQRPVVFKGERAVIARPSERVNELFD